MAMNIEKINIKEIKLNPKNPRTIKDDKFKKLVKSIKEFPEMLEVRPIVVDDDLIVLGGNMRLKACIEAGLNEISIIRFSNLSEEKKKEFIVKDNVGYGEWDFDLLLEDWDKENLIDWGMDLPKDSSYDNYTKKIDIPIYTPSDNKPLVNDLFDIERYNILINEIDKSNISDNDKILLKFAATRHIVFNYELIADYYAHSDKEVQILMENSALVLIDFNKAIELGFVKLSEDIKNQFIKEDGK
jgi:hypothetical protein